ncbi:hypothetical protein [Desulfofundulus thermocisternus]|uniref:hypothetical protein n=1 Tax=Desulfofundulus thermocisternus TaxID=42471 RepID=UPI0004879C0E|nr:hypothetical protein [Desulfofundulus thermocisternus]
MKTETKNKAVQGQRREQAEAPGPPKKGLGGLVGLGAALLLALVLIFGAIQGQSAPVLKSSIQASGGRLIVTVTDASGTRTYQAPCVFYCRNGTVTISTPDPGPVSYRGEISIGRHRVSGTVTPEKPVTYRTDDRGDLIQ